MLALKVSGANKDDVEAFKKRIAASVKGSKTVSITSDNCAPTEFVIKIGRTSSPFEDEYFNIKLSSFR